MESQHSFFTGFYVLWAVINNIEFLHRQAMKHVYTCPVHLPPAQDVFEQLLARTEFKICPFGTNLLFVAYAQHFIHQFIKTDFKSGIDFIWDEKGGDTPETMWNNPKKEGRNVSLKWALGHPHFSSNPWVFVIATIWIREHNRVCEILQMENPNWDDEQLYQTARLIITAKEMVLRDVLLDLNDSCEQYEMKINANKMKTMVIGRKIRKINVRIRNEALEELDSFKYLKYTTSSNVSCCQEVKRRIALAKEAFNRKRGIFYGPMEKELRKRLIKCFVWSVAL
ncbi:hypothetical protein ANN_13242 [Periplaneta americana]|uniref:Uncharacterized protein n=1 Tax=Periplaneta americana TaxID=6978 RepID=A0ABQ8TIV4_PERAM|nr:hypothetical protein ANN_13242 [Periplaneta americana]